MTVTDVLSDVAYMLPLLITIALIIIGVRYVLARVRRRGYEHA